MFYYRLYSLDPENGHFIDVLHFLSESDATAVLEVGPDITGVSRELWNRDRKVRDFLPRARADIDRANRFARLIGPGGRWRWNPLAGHCQVVATSDREPTSGHRAGAKRSASRPRPALELAVTAIAGETPCKSPCT